LPGLVDFGEISETCAPVSNEAKRPSRSAKYRSLRHRNELRRDQDRGKCCFALPNVRFWGKRGTTSLSYVRLTCVGCCKPMPVITTRSEHTDHWTKMPQRFARFSGSGPSHHTRSLAGFIIITFGFRFSVHTGGNGRGRFRLRRPRFPLLKVLALVKRS
jgi:hypothetical protein